MALKKYSRSLVSVNYGGLGCCWLVVTLAMVFFYMLDNGH